jgi:hypothetical protein
MRLKVFSTVVFIVLAHYSFSQPGKPNNGKKPGVPITGIEILIGLGGLYGFKRMINSSKNKDKDLG